MRVFSKKKFEFTNYETKNGSAVAVEKAVVEPLTFTDVPGWVVKDPLFGWAKKDGNLEVIESAKQQKKVEKDPLKNPPTNPPAE